MPVVDINYLAVVIAAVVNMVVGAAWYSPALFGKEWSRLIGRRMEDMRKNAGPGYAITTVGALVQSWIFAYLLGAMSITTAAEGASIGFLIWIAFVAVTQGVNTVFSGSRKKLWAINTGYFLVVLIINGAILAAVH
jgi:hypothetical protein